MKKLLVYGGAFDPPHLGHEKLLCDAIKAVEPDLILVTPSEVPPHKRGGSVSFFDRAHMSRAFLKLGDNVRISGIENSGKRRKSYTVNTVQRLKKRYKDFEIFLLVGSDMLVTFEQWRLYQRLCAMATLVAAGRQSGEREEMENAKAKIEKLGGKVILLDTEPLEISSTEIRERFKEGKSAEGLVSDFVARYVNKRGLYK